MQKIIFCILLFCSWVYASDNPPLRIAISHFSPPFVFQNSNHDLSGFDIDLMLHICKKLNRSCEFIPMRSSQVLTAIKNNQADMGLGGIDIGTNNYQNIRYSIPYMLSEYRFLGNKPIPNNKITLQILEQKVIGVKINSLAEKSLEQYTALNQIKLVKYYDTNKMISDLFNNKIDFAFVHSATANYWKNNSAGKLYIDSNPINVGIGIGIPINSNNLVLVESINNIINNYTNSQDYKQLYNIYFAGFSQSPDLES